MNFNEEERNTYEDRLKWLMIEAKTLKNAKEEGKVARSIEMAKKMRIKRKPVGEIMEFTDLTKEQIEVKIQGLSRTKPINFLPKFH